MEGQFLELKQMFTTLTDEVKDYRNEVKSSINNLEEQLKGISTRVAANELSVETNKTTSDTNAAEILAIKNELTELKQSVNMLQKENERLTNSLDEQIDRGMRETLVFSGKGLGKREKSWEETLQHLAKTLTSLEEKKVAKKEDRYTYNDFYDGVVRIHRGKLINDDNNIYAKFSSQILVDHIKTLSHVKKDIYISQLHSPQVNERLFHGRNLMRTLRKADGSKSWKMFLNDRCQLMHKKPGDQKYTMYKQF